MFQQSVYSLLSFPESSSVGSALSSLCIRAQGKAWHRAGSGQCLQNRDKNPASLEGPITALPLHTRSPEPFLGFQLGGADTLSLSLPAMSLSHVSSQKPLWVGIRKEGNEQKVRCPLGLGQQGLPPLWQPRWPNQSRPPDYSPEPYLPVEGRSGGAGLLVELSVWLFLTHSQSQTDYLHNK